MWRGVSGLPLPDVEGCFGATWSTWRSLHLNRRGAPSKHPSGVSFMSPRLQCKFLVSPVLLGVFARPETLSTPVSPQDLVLVLPLRPELIEVMADEAHGAAQDEKAVQAAEVHKVVSLPGMASFIPCWSSAASGRWKAFDGFCTRRVNSSGRGSKRLGYLLNVF